MSTTEQSTGEGPGGCLLRLVWMVAGNLVLVLALIAVAQRASPGLGWGDYVFWLMVPVVIAARYLDVTRFGGRNSDGQPATLADWRRHTIGLLVVAVLAYAVARVIGA